MDDLNRRAFLAAGAAAVTIPSLANAGEERDYPAPKYTPKRAKPSLKPQLVEDFVLFGHYDLEMVKKLLEKEPKLLNAAMDWGAGDWETALGGASHLGNHEIAEFLLSKGARIDIFAATSLGMLDVVKSMITIYPALIDAKGPHGIDLYMHARMGKDRAKLVLAYLQSVKPEPPKPEKKKEEPAKKPI
ncbi:ankyrin repeat domain-containing protein [Telmatocola sphagniphila]|jgi:hypothetical protein|uniref:Ankyrin repeat domain-containing protein n=1 Tax=Telmatocola sphagniphila TaxID=1123043 RepID=A0A8E6B684_9BACT|nr:ankyrin repeat domain-containing protein [Telmatocola sphagniphila]QVL31278.1 ankyrin repeat domain-containing protein [Telmatocola sphagniphila]